MKYYLVDKHWNFTSKDGELDYLFAEVRLGNDINRRNKEPNVVVQLEKILYSSGWFDKHVNVGKTVNVNWNDIVDSKNDVISFLFNTLKKRGA